MQKINRLLHSAFEKNASLSPLITAIKTNSSQMSYGDLNSYSNSIANNLKALGLLNEDHVCLLLDKSPEAIASIIGVLKAGGTYIPIDTQYPVHRVKGIITSSSPKIVLTQKKYSSITQKLKKSSKVLFIEEINLKMNIPNTHHISSKQLAYIIFTSGTSGTPKGVMIEHRSIVNTIESLTKKYYITKNSRVLQFSNLAFDSSIAEIFCTLNAGGTLVIEPDNIIKSIPKLINLIDSHDITTVTLPPALLNSIDLTRLKTLNTLVSAGENCPAHIANKAYKLIPHFINAYGPTECSICVCTYEVNTEQKDQVPIGKTLPNTQVYILNSRKRKVPNNVQGEIYVSGKGIARGYLNNKKATLNSFVSIPAISTNILYRTGDLAIRLHNGDFVYKGRTDHQVKVRGYRIELGEIEKHLLDMDGINSVAVCTVNKNNRIKMISYIVTSKKISSETIRSKLKKKLPEYMIPNEFLFIENMPLTHNKKIDREKLLAITSPKETNVKDIKINKNEERVSSIWKNILEVDAVSSEDNFFELGGDSLTAMRLVAELNSEFDLDIEFSVVFEHPRLGDFIEHVFRQIDKDEKGKKKK